MINFYVGELKFYVYLGKGGNREVIDIFLRNVSFWGILFLCYFKYCVFFIFRIYYWREYERIYIGEKLFVCSICGKKFNSNGSCKKYEKIYFRVEENIFMECNYCGKMFDDMIDFC